MAYRQKNNPLNTPVLKVEMEDDVMGKANKDGTIHINKNINDPKQIQDIVDHEKVHLDQMQRGDLDYDDNNVIWKGKKYSRAKMEEGAKNLPWEKEAYSKAGKSPLNKKRGGGFGSRKVKGKYKIKRVKQNKENKKFSLKQHRGNSDAYKTFQEKGLINSSQTRKNPPAFKFKDLVKNKKTTTITDRKTAQQAGVGALTPELFSKDQKEWLEKQNEEQRTKSVGGGFVGYTVVPGNDGTSTSTSGSNPRVGTGGVLNSPTPGTGFDLSAKADQTPNEHNDILNFTKDQLTNYVLDPTISTENEEAYANDPAYEWRDEYSTPGVTTDQKGYYNISTGKKAPNVDISADLKAMSDKGNILQPESYNIYGENETGNVEGGQDLEPSRKNVGNYTTNYEFAPQDQLLGDQQTYVGKQSNPVYKGQKTKAKNKVSSSTDFSKAKVRKGRGVRNADNPKVAKTLLPKRQITYNTQFDGNKITTTATKRFTRKKFEDTQKFFATQGTGKKLQYIGQGESGAEKFEKSQTDHLKRKQAAIDKRNKNLETVQNLIKRDKDA